jgi:hypothetical protein
MISDKLEWLNGKYSKSYKKQGKKWLNGGRDWWGGRWGIRVINENDKEESDND